MQSVAHASISLLVSSSSCFICSMYSGLRDLVSR
ncbi:Uncharacterised protein [Bordetella pertussis]|nr:Uncharacterised protein [Bordetella pertussis]